MYDGHNGEEAVNFVQENLHRNIFRHKAFHCQLLLLLFPLFSLFFFTISSLSLLLFCSSSSSFSFLFFLFSLLTVSFLNSFFSFLKLTSGRTASVYLSLCSVRTSPARVHFGHIWLSCQSFVGLSVCFMSGSLASPSRLFACTGFIALVVVEL